MTNAQGPRPHLGPGACSIVWDDADAPAWGSASHAVFWVAIEEPGPWGRAALTQSRLDPRLGGDLERACAGAGGRALLIRPPQRSRAGRPGTGRTVVVAGGMPQGNPWLRSAVLGEDELAALARLPWDELRAGEPAGLDALGFTPHPEPLFLVCTNGKRDVCCAVRGRPVARAAGAERPGQVWECTHTGGHRFAPTGLVLPHGLTLARLDAPIVTASLEAARADRSWSGLDLPRQWRGLAHLQPAAQAADAWVRDREGIDDLLALRAREGAVGPRGRRVDIRAADGRTWRLRVRSVAAGPARPGSCGAEPVPSTAFAVSELGEVEPSEDPG